MSPYYFKDIFEAPLPERIIAMSKNKKDKKLKDIINDRLEKRHDIEERLTGGKREKMPRVTPEKKNAPKK